MDIQKFSVQDTLYTADHGDGVTMNIIGSIAPEVIIAQYEPYYIGWRMKDGADSEEFEHYHAPCLQYIANGKEARIVTLLYPSNKEELAITKVIASERIEDTKVTLIINGKETVIDENDYPCFDNAPERL